MRVLALRHVAFEGLGRIEPVLAARGILFEYADLYLPGAALPALGTVDGLIILGGPMSANGSEPWLAAEIALIREAISRGIPILGICLGAQLIAKALGAAVYPNPQKEIGWFPLECSPAAAADPLFAGFGPGETVFHWHSETFDLAPGAVLLASSIHCSHQAVRYGQKIYALQFHLEVTPVMISNWLLQEENCGDVRELPAPLDPDCNRARLDGLAGAVFGCWAQLLGPICDSPLKNG